MNLYKSLAAVTLPDSGYPLPVTEPKTGTFWAMPSARAATPSGLSRFASSCQHRITIACLAIAAWCIVYFAAQMLRAVLS